MIIGSKNKGDWSELYVLLYLLGNRRLYAADEQLNRMDTFCFPIKRIMRNDKPTNKVDFILDDYNQVEIYVNSELKRKMTSQEFREEGDILYSDILSGKGSFNIPHAEQFLNEIYLERLAAPSTNITDITMELHDTNTGIDQIMGFSIKSYIGGAPTLLNASGATNFVYEIIGLNDTYIDVINSITTRTKIMDRISAISDNGGTMRYCRAANDVFSGNLMMIDSRMEEMLAELLLYSYFYNILDCKNIIEYLEIINPLHYPRKGLYTHKFKQFLCAKALGMEPGTVWSGDDNANGGYIVAKSDGEVLAYHLYNRDKFKQYLLENTKLERGSTSKHNYASIYKENGKMYINLNLQIRFK
ncbi:HpaII family restriction endonuclease [Faecalicoccus pleomorphus]|uniref:HpaII family restriction endonuclease n=1 Tax=Faecalicoccus pleomorphus TaxID=1323 RepID=UPI00195F28CE|nr:HpaII family restriction endonuclease [Faecalicoccus pleomorphus]MBM6678162.1 HpaII family restriction endonuclease [Faecalicoccus pleomorphus]